jgi:MiaB/RimO family radical SAM methylthiotransferase
MAAPSGVRRVRVRAARLLLPVPHGVRWHGACGGSEPSAEARESPSSLVERLERIKQERIPLRAFMKGVDVGPGAVRSRSNNKAAPRPTAVTASMLEPLEGGVAAELGLEEAARSWASGRSYFIETLGCQMNFSDSEIVAAVMEGAGYARAGREEAADVIFVNTCAIRENAEDKAILRLQTLRKQSPRGKQIGVLGCMAERMKHKLLENGLVNVVAGPDAYRDLPALLSAARGDDRAINVQLSADETYADIAPVRLGEGWMAYISITRGCNNMCSYCIVPFTRGRERSRAADSIVDEVRGLSRGGHVKEVTLLGQNVNSYHDKGGAVEAATEAGEAADTYRVAPGFADLFKARRGGGVRFGELLERVAAVDPAIRVRFTSPHPKDFTDDVLETIAAHPNICKGLHLPAQSGSDAVLDGMRRGYTRGAYLDLVARARAIVGPELELSTDIICGFPGESETDHQETLSLVREVGYAQAFMYAYSERERTRAYHKLKDDVPLETKMRRLREVVLAYNATATELAQRQVGKQAVVLIESPSKRNVFEMQGRTHGLRRCIVEGSSPQLTPPGTYVVVEVVEATMATLRGRLLGVQQLP